MRVSLLFAVFVGVARCDICCDCMEGDGGFGSCAPQCRDKAGCPTSCFDNSSAYKDCHEEDTCSCRSSFKKDEKANLGARGDICCDCMEGDGGFGSCAQQCRNKADCPTSCFENASAYNDCHQKDTCSCRSPSPGKDYKDIATVNNQNTTWTAAMPEKDEKANLGAGGDICCDCMEGDGGPGSCAPQCRDKAGCPTSCFDNASAYNDCHQKDTCSCRSSSKKDEKANLGAHGDICCDCMEGDGGFGSCAPQCRDKAGCPTSCFDNASAYNDCHQKDTCSCRSSILFKRDEKVNLGTHGDICCDCMEGDGGFGSCAQQCRNKASCPSSCFENASAYNDCHQKDTCSCRSSSMGKDYKDIVTVNNQNTTWTAAVPEKDEKADLVAFLPGGLLLIALCIFCAAGCFALHSRHCSQGNSKSDDRADLKNAQTIGQQSLQSVMV